MKPDAATIRPEHNAGVAARKRFRAHWQIGAVAAIIWALLVSTSAAVPPPKPNEYQVKAAYIYNFGKFVKWPAASAASQSGFFSICVLDGDPFGSVMQSTLAGQSIGGGPVIVKSITKPHDATDCRILFISSADESRLQEILSTLGQSSVLTVSDIPDFSKRGGMIQFILEGDRVRFEVNRASAEGAGLTLSSDLLKVAAAVRGTGRTGDK
jgi:YfiR/HmsC-like